MFADALYGGIERDLQLARPVLQFADGLGTDFAVGHVDDTLQAQIIIGIGKQAQIGQHIFNFFALINCSSTARDWALVRYITDTSPRCSISPLARKSWISCAA